MFSAGLARLHGTIPPASLATTNGVWLVLTSIVLRCRISCTHQPIQWPVASRIADHRADYLTFRTVGFRFFLGKSDMCVEKLNSLFCDGQTDVNMNALLEAIAAISDEDILNFETLRPSPLAIAVLHGRRPSGITVARTFQATEQPRTTSLNCPRLHILITLILADADISLADEDKPLAEGKLRAGTVFVTGPGRQLVIRSRSECDLLHLAVPVSLLRTRRGRQSDLDGLVVCDALIRQIGRLLCEAPSSWLIIYAELLGQLAVTRVLQLAPDLPPSCLSQWRLKKVKAFVDANIAEPLRLSDLAAACGLSRMHFAAQFRAATGLRPHDYVLSCRIEHAKQLMAAGESTLVQIALDAGFQSQAHFCTIFKRMAGQTPSAWRRLHVYACDISKGGYDLRGVAGRIPAAAFLPSSVALRATPLGPDAR